MSGYNREVAIIFSCHRGMEHFFSKSAVAIILLESGLIRTYVYRYTWQLRIEQGMKDGGANLLVDPS